MALEIPADLAGERGLCGGLLGSCYLQASPLSWGKALVCLVSGDWRVWFRVLGPGETVWVPV